MVIRIGRALAAGVLALAVSLSGCSGCGGAAERAEVSSSGTGAEKETSGAVKTEAGKTSGTHAPGDTPKDSAAVETSGEGGTSGRTETTAGTTTGTTAAANSTTAASAAPAPTPTVGAHEHIWEAQYQTVTVVDQEAYDETVVDQAAYDEQVPIIEPHFVCKVCGQIMDNWSDDQISEHMEPHLLAGEGSAYGTREVIVGYNTVHHDAVTHIVHHDAVTHTETQLTGYKCSTCGAIKIK